MKFANTLLPWDATRLIPDISAGVIIAIMLVPQAIAYAFLAGLPPEAGLFASLLPLLAYALLGSSPTLAVGPVAIISLMTLDALHGVVEVSGANYPAYATLLAAMTGTWLLIFFTIGLGSWTSFISHSVISGFTSAAALVIIISQLTYFTGLEVPRGGPGWEPLRFTVEHWWDIALTPLLLGIGGIILVLVWQKMIPVVSARLKLNSSLATLVNRSGPLILIISATLVTLGFQLNTDTVGMIPSGLPSLSFPAVSTMNWQALLLPSAILALIIFLESLSIANTMAREQKRRILPNQELLALGIANLAASITQAMPVAGGFGRSMVMVSSGARSQWAAVVTFIAMVIVALVAGRWFQYLPEAILGAIITVATWPLFRWQDGWKAWKFQRSDGLVWFVTFATVLGTNAETGIITGVGLSLFLYLKRTSQPHIAEVGRIENTDQFRNILRHKVQTTSGIMLIRVDENLYFANSDFLVDYILGKVLRNHDLRHVVIVGTAINHIDFCGVEALELLHERLLEQNIQLNLAEFKGPVMDQLARSDLLKHLSAKQVFFTASDALKSLQNTDKSKDDDFYTI
ncbi:MAG: SulP family inorganic anion transporter [Alcanivorax sp.]|jgi:SulP family sulfate permease|nr:MAG: sodium-independent anion transporter [Oceanobacter sp.]|tara:strand:- start:32753 stop:34474 length:1722 start_codon:yes stop_codon:yes gene_type:complete